MSSCPPLERARAALTASVPGTRLPGRPLAETLSEFEDGLREVRDGMDDWRSPDVEPEWRGVFAGSGRGARARRPGADRGRPSGGVRGADRSDRGPARAARRVRTGGRALPRAARMSARDLERICVERSSAVVRARGSSSGASVSRGRRRSASRTRSTGVGRSRGSGTRPRGSWSSGSRRPRTAGTGPAGSSPATARATSCSDRCIASACRTSPRRSSRDDGLRLIARVRGGREPVRPAGQQADTARARRLPARSSNARSPRSSGSACSSRSGRSRGTGRSVRCPRSGIRRGRGLGSATRPRRRWGRTRCWAATTRASRTRSPAS